MAETGLETGLDMCANMMKHVYNYIVRMILDVIGRHVIILSNIIHHVKSCHHVSTCAEICSSSKGSASKSVMSVLRDPPEECISSLQLERNQT